MCIIQTVPERPVIVNVLASQELKIANYKHIPCRWRNL